MAKPILLFTSIWEEQAENITNQILETPQNEALEIWLNSPGGSVSAGWAIIAVMNQHKAEKNITVMGDASSMAFFMLLFADNVTAQDSSNFLIHRAASFWEDIMDDEELKDIENRNKIIRKKLEARIDETIFEEVTGKTFDDIFSMNERLNVRLTAKQAKKIGLVNKIVKLDVNKKAEIESRYFHDIAALANTNTQNTTKTNINSNKNKNKMGTLKDLIFGEKDPVLLAKIGESQFVYSKLEKGAKIKATGEGDIKPISGTFEAKEKVITVIDNEITAITEIDKRAQELDTIKAELKAMKESQITTDDIVEVVAELKKQHTDEMAELKAILEKAKITASSQKLPEGEFQNDVPADDLTVRERLVLAQNKAHEDKLKTREV